MRGGLRFPGVEVAFFLERLDFGVVDVVEAGGSGVRHCEGRGYGGV